MDRVSRQRRTLRRTVSLLTVAVLAGGMLSVVASAAGAAACTVTDGMTSGPDLQSIIDGASTGDTIVVQGVCVGNYSIPGSGMATSLTLKGKGHPKAALDGGGTGSVVTVGDVSATFTNLLITNGHAEFGGGIYTDTGTITLIDTRVKRNLADGYGGGVEINSGSITVKGASEVSDNSAQISGGIDIYPGGTIVLAGTSKLNGNHANVQSGATDNYGATVTVGGHAQVRGNTSDGPAGAFYNYNGGTLTLKGYARVQGNHAATTGGGIQNGSPLIPDDVTDTGGILTMQGHATVIRNSATDGGGIYNDPAGTGTLVGAVAGVNVWVNTPNDIAP